METDEEIDENRLEIVEEPADRFAAGRAGLTPTELRAYESGWRPLHLYQGPAGKWKTAEQFLRDGEEMLPFVKRDRDRALAQLTANTAEMAALRSDFQAQSKQMQQLLDFSRKANDTGYKRAIADLKRQQREAAASADVSAYDEATAKIEVMETAREEVGAVDEPTARQPEAGPRITPRGGVDQAYINFQSENPWFSSDRVLNAAMIAEHTAVMEASPGMDLADQLDAAKEAVMERFPTKFGRKPVAQEPPRQEPRRPRGALPPSQGDRRRTNGGEGASPFDAIADAKERAEAKLGYRQTLKSIPNLSAQEYIDTFLDPHGDVLDTIDKHRPQQQPRRRANGR